MIFIFQSSSFLIEKFKAQFDNMHFSKSVNTKTHTSGIKFMDIAINFEEITYNIRKVNKLLNHGIMGEDVTRYLPSMD